MRYAIPLKPSRWVAIAAICLLAIACRSESSATVEPSRDASVVVPAASAPAAAGSGQAIWENGMSYATLRSRLLSRGWMPLPDTQCRANVVGDNHATLCATDPQQCEPCEALPELSACSGTGHCTMQFQREDGQRLSISTYGDVHRRTTAGEPEDLAVTAVEPATF